MPTLDAASAFANRPVSDLELAATLGALWHAAQLRWPTVRISVVPFFGYVGTRAAHDPAALGSLRITDLYIAFGCLERDPNALAQLDTELLPRARRIISSVGDRDFQTEVLQVTREKLLLGEAAQEPALRGYLGRGALLTWLRTVLYRTALSLKRDEPKVEPLDQAELVPDSSWSTELQFVRQAHRQAFGQAFAQALTTLDGTERSVLRLATVEKLNIDRIGLIYGAHRATVARWLARARQKLSEEIERRLRAQLDLTTPEFTQLIDSLRQNLGVSLERLLDEGG